MGLQESAIHNEGTFAANVLKAHLRLGAYDCCPCQARHSPQIAVNRRLGEPMIYKKALEVMKFHFFLNAGPAALSRRLGHADAVLPQHGYRVIHDRRLPCTAKDPDIRAAAEKQGKPLDEIVAVTLPWPQTQS